MRYALPIIAGLLIIVLVSLLVLSFIPVEAGIADELEAEPISFSAGYGSQMVEKRPFGDDGPIVIGCEGVYFD